MLSIKKFLKKIGVKSVTSGRITQFESGTSYQFSPNSLTRQELKLFRAFPKDYRDLIKQQNGGIVCHKNQFDIPMTRNVNGATYTSSDNSLEELWGFITLNSEEKMGHNMPSSVLHQHLRHQEENFLPDNVFSIGRCSQNSLVSISLNKSDYGSVYYWEWYWQYPWYKEFFQARIDKVASKFSPEVLENPDHPKHKEVQNELNYATLVNISDSFSSFLQMLK